MTVTVERDGATVSNRARGRSRATRPSATGTWRLVDGDIFGRCYRRRRRFRPRACALLAPVRRRRSSASGLNYKDHAAEQNKPLPAEPLLFLKPSTAVIGPGAAIEVPAWAGRVDHEAELGDRDRQARASRAVKAAQAHELHPRA